MTIPALDVQVQAETCLVRTREFILRHTIKTDEGWGLDRFLDNDLSLEQAGIYGTACGIRTLLTCGEPQTSYIIERYQQLLGGKQERDSGWSLNSLRSKEVLTTATCYAVNALIDSGADYTNRKLVENGIEWLKRTRRSDKGWGLSEEQSASSQTIPTAQVILTLSRCPKVLNSEYGVEGIEWLVKARNRDEYWGFTQKDSKSKVGVTSLVILSLTNRFSSYASYIQKPMDWLSRHPIPQMETDKEVFTLDDKPITYHLPTVSLVLSALLTNDENLYREQTLDLVKFIIKSQHEKGYWVDNAVGDRIPIWATMYACLALSDFNRKVDELKVLLELQSVHQRFDDVDKQIVELQDMAKKIDTDLNSVDQKVTLLAQSQKTDRNRHVVRLVEFMRKIPSLLKSGWPWILIVVSVVVSIYVYLVFPNNPTIVGIANVICGLGITLAIAVLKNRFKSG